MRSLVPFVTAALLATSASVAASDGSVRELRVLAYYSVKPGSHWVTAPHPAMLRRPSADALTAITGAPVPDFGVSFDCAVTAGGAVEDCRTMAFVPAGIDAATIVARLAPEIRLDPATVARAKADRYRVTFDAALMDFPPPPPPPVARCPGVTCGGDPPPPPPPPPQPDDPVLAFALARGHACYDAAWARMSAAADAADAALRTGTPATGTPAYRDLALDYVARRQALARCVDELRETHFAIPESPEDGRVYDVHADGMVDGYRQTDRDLIAVLAGALDRHAAEAERATSF